MFLSEYCTKVDFCRFSSFTSCVDTFGIDIEKGLKYFPSGDCCSLGNFYRGTKKVLVLTWIATTNITFKVDTVQLFFDDTIRFRWEIQPHQSPLPSLSQPSFTHFFNTSTFSVSLAYSDVLFLIFWKFNKNSFLQIPNLFQLQTCYSFVL